MKADYHMHFEKGSYDKEWVEGFFQAAKERGEHENLLLPVDALFAGCPALTLPENWTRRCKNGGEIPWEGEDGDYRVYGPDGEFLMLGRLEAGVLRTVKSFFEVSQG